MIPVGTRVIVHWEYYRVDLVYIGSDIFHGVVVEFDSNNTYDRVLKKSNEYLKKERKLIKVKIDEKGKMPDDSCYPLEEDVEIDENF